MNKKEIVKTVGGFVVSVGISSIVKNAIDSVTEDEKVGPIKKLCFTVGGVVLASMLVDKAIDYTDKRIDNVCDAGKEIVDLCKENKEEA